MEIALSNLGKNIKAPSKVSELNAAYANDFRVGMDINLGVGYVNDVTIPVTPIYKVLVFI